MENISITDIVSASVAFAALILTIYQMYATRQHNFLGVRPYLQFGWTAGESGDGIWLKNVGLGPAIIDKFVISKEGKKITTKQLEDELHSVGFESRMTVFKPGSTIQEKEVRWIVRPKIQIVDGETQNRFWDTLSELKFQIKYESFYERKEPEITWICPNPIKKLVRPKPFLKKQKDEKAAKRSSQSKSKKGET